MRAMSKMKHGFVQSILKRYLLVPIPCKFRFNIERHQVGSFPVLLTFPLMEQLNLAAELSSIKATIYSCLHPNPRRTRHLLRQPEKLLLYGPAGGLNGGADRGGGE